MPDRTHISSRRASFGARLLLVLALAAGCSSTEDAPQPNVDLGPHAVGHMQFTAVDAARMDRSLLVDIWYPADVVDTVDAVQSSYPLLFTIGLDSLVAFEELPVLDSSSLPLLVFSHGYRSINIQSTELMEALASHGFIILSPEHTGNAQASPTDTFDDAAANRVPDVSFLIDEMLAREQDPADPFHDRIDETKIGVVGNSFGAMTAIGMASGWAGASPDPRVKAIAPISAVVDGSLQSTPRPSPNAGFTEMQLNSVDVPVLLIGGTADMNVPIQNNQIAYDQLINAPDVYKVDVTGANHYHFAAICPIGNILLDAGIPQSNWGNLGAEDLLVPFEQTCTADAFPMAEATRLAALYTVAFFRWHLLGDAEFEPFLDATYADTEPAIAFSSR